MSLFTEVRKSMPTKPLRKSLSADRELDPARLSMARTLLEEGMPLIKVKKAMGLDALQLHDILQEMGFRPGLYP